MAVMIIITASAARSSEITEYAGHGDDDNHRPKLPCKSDEAPIRRVNGVRPHPQAIRLPALSSICTVEQIHECAGRFAISMILERHIKVRR